MVKNSNVSAAVLVMALAALAVPARAQYDSGSSGVHGVFPPAPVPATTRYVVWNLRSGLVKYCSAYDTITLPETCTTEVGSGQITGITGQGVTTGVYEFTSFDFGHPTNGTTDIFVVGHDGSTPLSILSQTAFRLRSNTSLRLDGQDGASTTTGLPPTGFGAPGGRPGPGGFAGGNGGKMGTPSTPGNAGFGPAGGAGGQSNPVNNASLSRGSNAGATPIATSLVPLIGGSGGGGQGAFDTVCGFRGAGGAGGGGGGALLVAAATQIVLDNSAIIDARGGDGGRGCQGWNGGTGGGGSVRLVSPVISGTGQVLVGTGIVRFEGNASAYSGNVDATRGTVLSAPQPAQPTGLPVLRITSVGGIAVGANPSGAIGSPDVTFATPPPGPVAVDLSAANIPVGTVVNLRANPLVGTPTTAVSSALTGTAAAATASASLQIPPGAGVITATTSFPVTTAMLGQLPVMLGFAPERVEVVADGSGASRVFLLAADMQRAEVTLGTDGRLSLVK